MELKDIELAIKLSQSIKDGFCPKPPPGFTSRDIDHLANVKLCDRLPGNAIVVIYNIDELEELKEKAMLEQEAQEKAKRKEERDMKNTAFKAVLSWIPSLLEKLLAFFAKG